MITVKEAEKMWCPMTRMVAFDRSPSQDVSYSATASNRSAAGLRGTCIGDQCMMWRWGDSDSTHVEMVTYNLSARREAAPTTMILDDSKLKPTEEEILRSKPVDGSWIRGETFFVPGAGWRTSWQRESSKTRKGYCGLAGKTGE